MKSLTAGRIAFLAVLVVIASGADWRQFRGTDNRGVAEGVRLPVTWSATDNIAWKAPLPGRSASSPIVVGGRVIVTTSSGARQDRLHVLAFDASSGRRLWLRQFWATGRTLCHPMSANAAPTPASDGKRIFAFFSSNDLACLDLDGNLLWFRGLAYDYPQAGNDAGMSSSPLVVGDTVVVQCEAQGESFAAGIDTATGETRWHHQRKRQASWSSPAVHRGESPEQDAVLLQSPSGLTLLDPHSGRVGGTFEAPCAGIASATAADGVVYLPSRGITALRFSTGSEKPEVLWQDNRLNPNACSPVVAEGRIYTINRTILVAADAATGQKKWQLRLSQGMYWGSPVVASGHLYVVSHEGLGHVVRLEDGKGEMVAKNDFGEKVLGTPAIAGDALYIQSEKNLWKIAADGED